MMPDMSSPLTIDVKDGIAHLVLARGRGNAIDAGVVEALASACRRLEEDDAIRAVLLGAEGKLFCPGLDLPALIEKDRAEMESFMRSFASCVRALFSLGKPMLAALHGHAVAGGCVLALTADWRVIAPHAQLGLNEVKVGVPIPFGPTTMLREVVRGSQLTAVALLGRNFRGQAAVDVGLAHELGPEVEKGDATAFRAACVERLAEFADKDPTAYRATKRYLRSAAVERMREHDPQLVGEFLDAWFSPGTQARIRAVVEQLQGS